MNKRTLTLTKWHLSVCVVGTLFMTSSCKEYVVTPPPVPSVSFKNTNVTITATETYYVEIEASEAVGAYDYPVYLRLEGDAIADERFSHSHPLYEDSQGNILLQAMMAQGSTKTALVIRPAADKGPASLTVSIMPDQQGNRYTVAQQQAVATVQFTN